MTNMYLIDPKILKAINISHPKNAEELCAAKWVAILNKGKLTRETFSKLYKDLPSLSRIKEGDAATVVSAIWALPLSLFDSFLSIFLETLEKTSHYKGLAFNHTFTLVGDEIKIEVEVKKTAAMLETIKLPGKLEFSVSAPKTVGDAFETITLISEELAKAQDSVKKIVVNEKAKLIELVMATGISKKQLELICSFW